MLITIQNPTQNSYQLLHRAGYGIFNDPNSGKVSYTRRLGSGHYPRFHIYIEKERGGELQLNLHLDQKQASYPGQTTHSGEYDTNLVSKEAERIKNLAIEKPEPEPEKRGFWKRIFGKK